MKKTKTNTPVTKKIESAASEEQRVNIRAIRNKELLKPDGGLTKKGTQRNNQYKNSHAEHYGESEDSEDERILSKIGRLQTQKYKDKDFIGYDENLNKIVKKTNFEDKLEEFIQKTENKDWWRVVRDELNNQDVILSDKQLNLLDRIRKGKAAKTLTSEYFEFDNFDSNNFLSNYMPKRRFIASKWERIKINKLVEGIKQGRIRLHEEPKIIDQIYDIWTNDIIEEKEGINKYLPPRIPASKTALPTNAASYNPSSEYLFTPEEQEKWLQTDPEDRDISFLPHQYRYLRSVPSTPQLAQDLFNRCLDLYLCPRVRRQKLMMKSSDFLPELPNPEDLRPYPTHLTMTYTHDQLKEGGAIIGIAINDNGTILAVCYQQCLALFDVRTSRCIQIKWSDKKQTYYGVQFSSLGIIALIKLNEVELIKGNYVHEEESLIQSGNEISKKNEGNPEFIWTYNESQNEKSFFETLINIELPCQPKFVNFHPKSDYFVTTQPEAPKKSQSILVHCISKSQTQVAFQNMKASTEVQQTLFHPTQPHLIIMTKKHVFIYALNKQSLIKKLLTGNKYNSSVQIHPLGDHILLGSFDKKVCWFDLDMGVTPYKKMSYHEKAIKKVCFHNSYPLFASASDDATINVFYGKISTTDLSQAPTILPLKVLKKQKTSEQHAIKDIIFHPQQPWIFSADSKSVVSLWT